MKFDHVALVSNDISKSVKWYVENWNAKTIYLDETWGLIELAGTKIAFVTPSQHPAHICFEVSEKFVCEKLEQKTFKAHRDGSSSSYVRDVDGNFIEFLLWPNKGGENETD